MTTSQFHSPPPVGIGTEAPVHHVGGELSAGHHHHVGGHQAAPHVGRGGLRYVHGDGGGGQT